MVSETGIPGVVIVEPPVFQDDRGFFMETYQQEKYAALGLPRTFVQDNLSHSVKNVLRGLHYQLRYPQGKLLFVIKGEIFDVAVDIRKGSPTFGRWAGTILSEENKRQFYVPEGFAHGFCVLSHTAHVVYKCTEFYHPEDDRGVNWSDTQVNIDWPITNPLLSDKDRCLPTLSAIPDHLLPAYK